MTALDCGNPDCGRCLGFMARVRELEVALRGLLTREFSHDPDNCPKRYCEEDECVSCDECNAQSCQCGLTKWMAAQVHARSILEAGK